MSDLFQVHNWEHMLKNGRPPRIVEVPVDPKGAPYLVSNREGSESSFLWITRANQRGMVRACPRKDLTFRTDVIKEIVQAGEEKNIGNVHPLTAEGVEAAISYLESFGFKLVEALVAPDVHETFTDKATNVYVKEWVPEGHVILLPENRAYVGDMGQMSTGHFIVVVHNPLRGIAIAKK